MSKSIKGIFICGLAILLTSACGNKSAIKNELENVRLSGGLPEVTVTECRKLAQAEDAVYEQQIAACELYIEAHELTKTSDFAEAYDAYKKDRIDKKIAYYCNERRKDLQLEIATELNDNVRLMVRTVDDCENIDAYVDRVNSDVVNFYDYYDQYMNSDSRAEAACDILTTFYTRNNILAFRFMNDHRSEFIRAAVNMIVDNSHQTKDLGMYISHNNQLIKALNTVYGGISSEYAETVTRANRELARRMLEEDNNLSEEDINSLMYQLGEPTPSPEPTPEPTEKPTEVITEIPQPQTARPSVTTAPRPTSVPRPTAAPRPQAPAATPEVYIFGE